MKTGIVVNNYDPTFKNRCQIRVYGLHTQKVGGQYVILDDDLPWALPASDLAYNSGNYSVPKVGERVYVDVKDAYNIIYYGGVEIKGTIKDLLHDNAESSDQMKVIAFSEDYNDDGTCKKRLTDKYEYLNFVKDSKFAKKKQELITKYKKDELDEEDFWVLYDAVANAEGRLSKKFIYRINKFKLNENNQLYKDTLKLICEVYGVDYHEEF